MFQNNKLIHSWATAGGLRFNRRPSTHGIIVSPDGEQGLSGAVTPQNLYSAIISAVGGQTVGGRQVRNDLLTPLTAYKKLTANNMSQNKKGLTTYKIIALVIATAIITISFTVYLYALMTLVSQSEVKAVTTACVTSEVDVEREIREQSALYDLDGDKMVAIAWCESRFNPNARNLTSTANGIFQILDGTWENFDCKGGISNAKDNIKCAMKIASLGGYHHWECNN